AADGRRAVPLGVSHALMGDSAFGASGFRYCGSILVAPAQPLFGFACRLASVVTEAFGLVGVNGIDFVARGDVPYAVEVNPRYCASMELVERARGISIFELHARACAGELTDVEPAGPGQTELLGKAIVYARTVEHVTCLGCGCACDDITVVVQRGRLTEAQRACALGAAWFGDGQVPDAVRIRGRAGTLERALAEATALVTDAKRPLVYLAGDI